MGRNTERTVIFGGAIETNMEAREKREKERKEKRGGKEKINGKEEYGKDCRCNIWGCYRDEYGANKFLVLFEGRKEREKERQKERK